MIDLLETYIDIGLHILLSLIVGYFIWKKYGKKLLGKAWKKELGLTLIISLLAGLMIDIDHFLDYFIAFGMRFHYEAFMTGGMFLNNGKTYILFHGFEYAIILAFALLMVKEKKTKYFLLVIIATYSIHLFTDSILYGAPIMDYFLIYRIQHGFQAWYTHGLLDAIFRR